LKVVAALIIGLVALGCSPALSEDNAAVTDQAFKAITVEAQPVAAFDKIDAGKTRFGKLMWRGGLRAGGRCRRP